ncbi:hypothetical protein [Polaribacter aquimarinus]|uniref:Lipoprotein n=1 Tax=Polaribacter aquimarinus TaxID=2100726 RepID=A0A2U2J7A1_9FLAO|nr:hypothetical protein [Polaribacter aquimarinus]PWG04182.1 hypothetical protein DIS07_14560 [Polaribacter aquimarinus]
MKRKVYLFLTLFVLVFSFTSCKVSKNYVAHISKKEEIDDPKTKKVLIFASDDVRVNEFKKTFQKNFPEKKDFSMNYLDVFSEKLHASQVFSKVYVDSLNTTYTSVNKEKVDYVIHFSNFEIANRIEWNHSAGMNMNGVGGMNTTTSVEYCIINVKVEVYDAKTNREILDFVAIGEDSVFLFNFTKTLHKAKERSILHIINYLKSGKISYKKY